MNFEAGALAKTIETSRVVPLLIDLTPAEVKDPLAQFQSQKMDQEGVCKVVAAINDALPNPRPAHRIDKLTNLPWPTLEKNIQDIEQRLDQDLAATQPNRSDRELLERYP